MSDTGNERPAGWYHAEGDPPGTQRYWDGSAWQGGPQAAPDGGGLGGAAFGGAAAQAMTSMPGMGGNDADYKGFFPTLFDFSLSSFLAPKVIRILYIIGVVLICLGGVAMLIAFLAGGGTGILLGLIIVPLFTLFYLILVRIQVEFVIVAFRTFEQVKQLRADME